MPALPPVPNQFTAEIIRSDDNERTQVYVNGWFRRIDTYSADGESKKIIIFRPDRGIIWSLSPTSKTYSQSKLPGNLNHAFDPDSLFDWTENGTEIIDGRKCRRFDGHYINKGRPEVTISEIRFVDCKTGIHRRTVTYNKTGQLVLKIDCLKAVVGAPPKSVFDMPAGYNRAYHKTGYFRARGKSLVSQEKKPKAD